MKKEDILLPTTVTNNHKSLIMDTPAMVLTKESKPVDPPLRTEWLNIDKHRQGSMYSLATSIRKGLAIAASDGSYMENTGQGTASWIITTGNTTNFISAGAISLGPNEIQNSYRSELLGLLGILEELVYLCQSENIQSGSCTIFCDGVSALHMVEFANTENIHPNFSNSDILSACAKLNNKIPLELRYEHIKGHQDDNISFDRLSIPAQLNVLMDSLAKDLLKDSPKDAGDNLPPHRYSFPLPSHKQQMIHYKFKSGLYDAIATDIAQTYWIDEKKRYTRADISSIDWDAQYKALKAIRGTRQRTLSKWCSGWIATGKNMKRWDLRYRGNCPFCGVQDEDTKHVLMCPHQKATSNWSSKLSDFDKKLTKYRTSYYLRKAIILELRAWRNNTEAPSLNFSDQSLKPAILKQRRLGWRLFLEGLITKDIIQYQNDYLKQTFPDKKLSAWTKKVLMAGWDFIMNLWEFRNETLHQPNQLAELQGIRPWTRLLPRSGNGVSLSYLHLNSLTCLG